MIKTNVQRLQENTHPQDNDMVRYKETGNVSELMYSEHTNGEIKIRKLNAEQYVRLESGEVLNFEHIENRADDKNSVRVTLQRLRDYLNTNITDNEYCRWVTLTYRENMTDTKRLYKDFEKLVKRLRYKYGKFEYIVACEPQGRGAWHMHTVMIFEHKAPFIPCDTLEEVWGQGFCKVKKLENVDNVGAYLTAYLGDMELDENSTDYIPPGTIKEVSYEEDGIQKTKKFIKGARLCLYPPKFNLYRCSRGIKKPFVERMAAEKAEKKVSSAKLTFERTLKLSDTAKGFENILNYRYYNTKR